MVVKMKKLINNQKGQAIFELIIFIPFLVFLYAIYYTVGNSISGSINQQKAVRGYFYALTKGNSYINTLMDLEQMSDSYAIKEVGFSSIGWRIREASGASGAYAPCFKFAATLNNDSTEKCDDKTREIPNESSRLIRIFTFYGVCGPAYKVSQNDGRFFEIDPTRQNNPYGCSLAN
jgi:hypothetical protein